MAPVPIPTPPPTPPPPAVPPIPLAQPGFKPDLNAVTEAHKCDTHITPLVLFLGCPVVYWCAAVSTGARVVIGHCAVQDGQVCGKLVGL